jgi:hypothetical protein
MQVPDLIGVKDRRYLDHTGLVRHRDIGDFMRYAAINQGADLLASYGGSYRLMFRDSRNGLPPALACVTATSSCMR